MPKQNSLLSILIKPGRRVIITDEKHSSTYPPGTLGYTSYISSSESLICRQSVYIIRRGKSGKNRLEAKQFYLPVYYFKDPKYISNIGTGTYYVLFRPEEDRIIDVSSMSPLDFIAWASAYIHYLKGLTNYTDYTARVWPTGRNHVFNHLLQSVGSFNSNPDGWVEAYSNETVRRDTANKIRAFETKLYRCSLRYLYGIESIKISALSEVHSLVQAGKFDIPVKTIKSTISTVLKKQESLKHV